MTQRQLAQFLRVNRLTLYRWNMEDLGPPRLLRGKRWVYAIEDVRQWLISINEIYLLFALGDGSQFLDPPEPTVQSLHLELAI